MLIPSRTDLVPAAHATLDLGLLAQYSKLKSRISIERDKYYRIHRQTLQIVNSYFDKNEHFETVLFLRREIRIATRGAPTKAALDSVTAAGYISNGTEQLYNAQSELVRTAYQQVAPLVHPDRSKYSRELFQQVRTAYALRDLTFLQETYITLVHEHNLFWRTRKGLDYVRQEIERPKVSLRILQSTPEFGIARAHLTGKPKVAESLAEARMTELVVMLNAELSHLLKPHGVSNVEQESEGRGTTDQEEESCASGSGRTNAEEESDGPGRQVAGRIQANADPESAVGEGS
jgi:hypothetical protein